MRPGGGGSSFGSSSAGTLVRRYMVTVSAGLKNLIGSVGQCPIDVPLSAVHEPVHAVATVPVSSGPFTVGSQHMTPALSRPAGSSGAFGHKP